MDKLSVDSICDDGIFKSYRSCNAILSITVNISSPINSLFSNNFPSNTFTAPVTGKYQLQASVRIDNIDTASDYYQLTLNTSNRTYPSVFLLDPGVLASDPAYWTAGFAILADMDAYDEAYIYFSIYGGTKSVDIDNGYLTAILLA